jgi:hypothetical protein
MNQEQKNAIKKLWGSSGRITASDGFYFGEHFKTFEEYYELIAELHGIEGGVKGLKRAIIKDANEYLSKPESQDCPNVNVRLQDINLEEDMRSETKMYQWAVQKMGRKPTFSYYYDLPDDWECSVDANSDDNDYYNEMECFDDECLMGVTREVGRIIYKKYGIYGNTTISERKENTPTD